MFYIIMFALCARLLLTVGFAAGLFSTVPSLWRMRQQVRRTGWWLTHDCLTRQLNRAGLLMLEHEPRWPGCSIVMLLDVDEFKQVNDGHGHDVGDQLLRVIGQRLARAAHRHGGVAARLSGDEFALALPARGDVATVTATVVAMTVGPIHVETGKGPVALPTSVSAGACVIAPDDSIERVGLRHADIAMYHAKKRKDGPAYATYKPGMQMPAKASRRQLRPLDTFRNGAVEPSREPVDWPGPAD
ncbi:diguanylate cyclase domain-containing protein [Catellatospora chokoriensis]|uniref:GGDEF domain-containing protein n=1 Tax=Catellatospora chokoriensis TaxID=310353 RepID=A0A8J3K5S0_9ACTN|nr:diguanylate cyclase [Catellatospora chokoriensis]GIF93631.1 hypothetical protein Cch02nite_70750 [Catellatospora chokoriensis]